MRPYDTPDHPTIRNLKLFGWPDGKEAQYPKCPICNEETDTFYRNSEYDIVGCGICITSIDAWDHIYERGSLHD